MKVNLKYKKTMLSLLRKKLTIGALIRTDSKDFLDVVMERINQMMSLEKLRQRMGNQRTCGGRIARRIKRLILNLRGHLNC